MPIAISAASMDTERENMTQFWHEHSRRGSVNEMMLDENADELGSYEIPEILSLLPDIQDKRVLELGAGIGRFTGLLADQASFVHAIDFMENFVVKNKQTNGHRKNVKIQQADVTSFQPDPSKKFDVIFSNWLLMYLTDEEVHKLACNMLLWLKDGGTLFIRESCCHQSGNASREFNPTKYRQPDEYSALLLAATSPTDRQPSKQRTQDIARFTLRHTCRVNTYVTLKNNANQVTWTMQKLAEPDFKGFATQQEFLDKKQYTSNGILRYEHIFGHNYISTGGQQTTTEFLRMVELKGGDAVLDVGCGIGGAAFYMAQEYGAHVKAIDLSSNVIDIAQERLNELEDIKNQVEVEVADVTTAKYANNSYDLIHSRDVILHIAEKKSLFSLFYNWLKPGGKLLISDYCCSAEEWSTAYAAYVQQRGYDLHPVAKYGQMLEEAGFVDVLADDRTEHFMQILQGELNKLRATKDSFLKKFSQKDYDDLEQGWESKLVNCKNGDQKWGLFIAEKPRNSKL